MHKLGCRVMPGGEEVHFGGDGVQWEGQGMMGGRGRGAWCEDRHEVEEHGAQVGMVGQGAQCGWDMRGLCVQPTLPCSSPAQGLPAPGLRSPFSGLGCKDSQ